jgi:pyruvate,water dikinase
MWAWLLEALDGAVFGGKAAGLARASRAGLPVPRGIALTSELVALIVANDAGPAEEINDAVTTLGPSLAVRSSARGEDGASASFAGQYVTRLGVRPDKVAHAVAEVAGSGTTASAAAYRARMGLDAPAAMAVVIQAMVPADVAGVMFTRDPRTGAPERVIEASYGLGESVVAGLVVPDFYRLTPDGSLLEARIAEKDLLVRVAEPGGTEQIAVPAAQARAAALTDAALAELVHLAEHCELTFGQPCDIEWAWSAVGLSLLQCRPMTRWARRRADQA